MNGQWAIRRLAAGRGSASRAESVSGEGLTAGQRWVASRDERGSATVLMVGIMAVVVVLSAAALVVAGYVVGAHRARAAADLSALSAAAAFQQGNDGCAQARRTARQNGARVTGCDRVGDEVDFVLTVKVIVPVDTRIAGMPRTIPAQAHAEPLG